MPVESNSRRIATILSQTPVIGISELVEATGLTRKQVAKIIENLMVRGVVESIPKRYELTAKGVEELQRPNGFPSRGVPGTGKRRRNQSAAVGFGRTNRHALDTVWSAA